MKKSINAVFRLLCLTTVLAACEKRDPEFFDESANGAYFDYAYAQDYDQELNFSDHIVGWPDTVTLNLKVKLLGYLKDEARTLAIKTKPIEGYALANILIDEVVFADNEYQKDVEVKVMRPEAEDSLFAVCMYLDGSGDIGLGIQGKDSIKLYVTESYKQPAVWYGNMEKLLGAWSQEKQIFLARHTGDNKFYDKLYDSNQAMPDYESCKTLNVSAVNALFSHKDSINGEMKDSIDEVVDFPILRPDDRPNYAKPYSWDLFEEKLGHFRANTLAQLAVRIGGSTVREFLSLCDSEEELKSIEKDIINLHKIVVKEMLDQYYVYAQEGYTIAEYDTSYWVKIGTSNYDMRIPFWWEDPYCLGTAEVVKKYFGEYGEPKYEFMLKEMSKADGADVFIAASVLPFVYNIEGKNYEWDAMPFGKKGLVGEERLKECYRIIKAANDKRPANRRFDIPEVEL